MKPQKFSLKKRAVGFGHAFAGIKKFLLSEHNARFHFIGTILVLIASLLFKVSHTEAIALTGMVGFVWVAEMFNTCIEKIMDFISEDRHPDIQFIKDVSAGAVLVASVTAFITGLFIFIPKIL
jgi:diacylglycerol kinase (ATP)